MASHAGGVSLMVLAALLSPLFSAPGSVKSVFAAPPVLVEAAWELIEGVLGPGTVKAIRAAGAGSELLVRWDSPSFPRALGVNEARDMIHGEAVLATGAVFGHLHAIRRIRFTIVRGERMLATGEHVRGEDPRMIFAAELGGPYAPGLPGRAPMPTPSGGAPQEL